MTSTNLVELLNSLSAPTLLVFRWLVVALVKMRRSRSSVLLTAGPLPAASSSCYPAPCSAKPVAHNITENAPCEKAQLTQSVERGYNYHCFCMLIAVDRIVQGEDIKPPFDLSSAWLFSRGVDT